jgi:hypothetical protein
MHGPRPVYGLGLGSLESSGAVLRNISAMFIAASSVNVFVLAVVTAVQSLTLAVAGPGWFARVSPVMHIALVATAILALVALPSAAADHSHWPVAPRLDQLASVVPADLGARSV